MSFFALHMLRHDFPDDQLALYGDDDEFGKLNSSYLSALENEIVPTGIFDPKSAEDVSKFSTPFKDDAIDGLLEQMATTSWLRKRLWGITIDLRHLAHIEVKNSEGIVSVGAGARWGKIRVYEAVQEKGLGVTGSRSARGGVRGLALSDGLSFFSSREGFIYNNVANFEVVLSLGKIINTNADENKDLWWALRGGGNNLGVVTRSDLWTFEQGPFWGGAVFYHPPSFPGQIEALVDLLKQPASMDTHLMLSIGYSALCVRNLIPISKQSPSDC